MTTSVQTDNLILPFLSVTSIQMFAIKLSLKHETERNFQGSFISKGMSNIFFFLFVNCFYPIVLQPPVRFYFKAQI